MTTYDEPFSSVLKSLTTSSTVRPLSDALFRIQYITTYNTVQTCCAGPHFFASCFYDGLGCISALGVGDLVRTDCIMITEKYH